jgi:hypothetical protein
LVGGILSISKVRIRNFRSIVDFQSVTKDLNIFVGKNDEGKSNVLRALDLFFNHDKINGYILDWNIDYCYFAPKRKRKAEEISVQLEISLPTNFRNQTPVLWEKTWRREGLHKEVYKHKDGKDVSARSKIAAFLKSMRFDYVPAIKGEDYFQSLMSKLYDMLEATVEGQIRAASSSFTSTINENTKNILEQIKQRLDMDTTIELPSNLRDMFAQLEFTSTTDEIPFSLKQRGDGIKVRHIPIVLRWLAEQANYRSVPGRPKAVTIWGYEEPENNLELRRCFDLAKEFVAGANTIQTFITTHSPALYSVSRESDPKIVKLFLVTKENNSSVTKIKPIGDEDLAALDSSMGLMDFLEPHFKEAKEAWERQISARNDINDTNSPTIFCEGESDKVLLDACNKLFFPDVADNVVVKYGGGHPWVGDMMIVWSHSRPKENAVGLFDMDKEAQATRSEVNKKLKKSTQSKVFGISLQPSTDLIECYKHNISVPYAIEELIPRELWDYAEQMNWLEDRKDPIAEYGFKETNISFSQYFKNKLTDSHLRRIALRKVKWNKKKDFSKYICGLRRASRRKALEGMKPTIEKCLQKLGLIKD